MSDPEMTSILEKMKKVHDEYNNNHRMLCARIINKLNYGLWVDPNECGQTIKFKGVPLTEHSLEELEVFAKLIGV